MIALSILIPGGILLSASYLYLSQPNAENLRAKILNQMGSKQRMIAIGIRLYGVDKVESYYKSVDFKPSWIGKKKAEGNIDGLLNTLYTAEENGLVLRDYHRNQIRYLALKIDKWIDEDMNDSLAQLDILLTDACLSYAMDISTGQVDDPGINLNRNENLKTIPYNALLKNALDSQEIQFWLRRLLTNNCKYQELKEALSKYRNIYDTGGFVIPASQILDVKPGDKSDEVPVLIKYLKQTGDIEQHFSEKHLAYDGLVANGLLNFQRRNGLYESAIVDIPTYQSICIPIEDRIISIIANMERLRWLPPDLGQKYIMVNIADFSLRVFRNYSVQLKMKIVVGKPYKQTPVFHSLMKYVVFNPTWDVPKSIMTEEILPKLRKNPGYLAKHHMKLYNSKGVEISPYKVRWWRISPQRYNLKIVQQPGPWNSLGSIKFLFPNPYSVYLHGTPDQNLFEKNIRAFSHGCIRVEYPVELATYILNQDLGWTQSQVMEMLDNKDEHVIALKQIIPVHVTYQTAWINEYDQLCFRDDIYDRDSYFKRYVTWPIPRKFKSQQHA